ncbi:MAG: hypothetical protein U1E51_16300 [Candidatus Binatia bacterium]|nr:hypothetical protein [Candidatus Binatia bacterium]
MKRFSNVGGTLDFFGSDASIKKLFPDKDYTREKFSFPTTFHSGCKSRRTLTVNDSIRSYRTAKRRSSRRRS